MQIGPVVIGASPGIQINLVNSGDAPQVFQFQGKMGYYYVILAMLCLRSPAQLHPQQDSHRILLAGDPQR